MQLDLLAILIILALSTIWVLFGPEPPKQKLAEIGGTAFLLWLVLQLFKYLLGKGGP